MSIPEYAGYDAMGLAELVAKGDAKPSELCEEAIARIEKHNSALNAVIFKTYDLARERARELDGTRPASPFHGVPFLLKDILGDHQGMPTTSGSRFLAGNVAAHDATLTARYRDAGFVFLGKTNAPEFGILPTTEPVAYGPSCNPWNLEHSTGGSSGGSGAAVAAGIVPAAHANDGGGSIRIPASCCGLVGLKPTRARNPLGPVIGDALGGLIAEHVVTRSVRDSAAILDCTHGPEAGDPYHAPTPARPYLDEVGAPTGKLKFAYVKESTGGSKLHPECEAAIDATLATLVDLGHTVEEAKPAVSDETLAGPFMQVWAAGLAFNVDAIATVSGRSPEEELFEPLTWALYQAGREVSASQYLIAVAMLQMVSREIGRFSEGYDAWITPTLGAPPIKNGVIDTSQKDVMAAFAPIIDYVPFTAIANVTGQPSISLPLHWSADNLPVGVLFTGRFGDEASLLRIAAQLEQAKPWIDRKPPVWD